MKFMCGDYMTRHEPRYIRINNCGECPNAYIKDSCLCCDKACGDSVDCYDGNAESRQGVPAWCPLMTGEEVADQEEER